MARAVDDIRLDRPPRGGGWPVYGLMAVLALSAADPAQAETRFNVHYTITMVGITIGHIGWDIDLDAATYKASASGKASGALSVLVNGEGRIATQGTFDGAHFAPTFFASNTTDDGKTTGLQMTFENGSVKTLRTDEPLRKTERIPVSEADRQNVTDPLSAMLIATPSHDEMLAAGQCNHVLPIFDGQRRYNLTLSFKRADQLKIDRGYSGPVLVCGVTLQPIAGYRPDSMTVKYVAGRRDMEIWFAPIAETNIIAPARLLVPTLIGTLEIDADRFEAVAPALVPATAGPTEPAR